ncbi:MAG: hypothetical protein ACXWKM_00200 [Phenylobacterium sp.]
MRILLTTASVLACVAVAATAAARPVADPLRPTGHVGPKLAPYSGAPRFVGTWTPLTHGFPGANFPDTALLLTDGSVLMHNGCSPNWFKLTPSSAGSYVDGTWSSVAAMPSNYTPLYFASQVLASGMLLVNGGEYNTPGCTGSGEWTALGAIYDPVKDKWYSTPTPLDWADGNQGDAASVVLPDGRFMLQHAVGFDAAVASVVGHAVTWSSIGAGKGDFNDEEGWTLLPTDQLLTVQTNVNLGKKFNSTELFDIGSATWSAGPHTPKRLVDPKAHEIGPAVLMYDGKVFQAGANPCTDTTCATAAAAHTGVYDPLAVSWTNGPTFPNISGYNDVSDGPAAILPNGHVLVQASPNYGDNFNSPSHFYEFDGTTLIRANEPATAPNIASFEGRMLVLPTGEILWSSDWGDVEVYTSSGAPVAGIAPAISKVPGTLTRGHAGYKLSGRQLNGFSQGAAYGDDAQSASNYPLVRISNDATSHVCYPRTHDHSTMGISSAGLASFTKFDMPAASPPAGTLACETGASHLVVVVNGIASTSVAVTVN